MVESFVASAYAGLLVQSITDRDELNKVKGEWMYLSNYLHENKNLMKYINSSSISLDSKKQLVHNIFSGKLSDVSINFVDLLLDNGIQSAIVQLNGIINSSKHV